MDASLTTWTVKLSTPEGEAELDVPTTLGPEAAGRRAHIAACQLGWGDIDQVHVIEIRQAEEEVQ